jgi:hypothetical protein
MEKCRRHSHDQFDYQLALRATFSSGRHSATGTVYGNAAGEQYGHGADQQYRQSSPAGNDGDIGADKRKKRAAVILRPFGCWRRKRLKRLPRNEVLTWEPVETAGYGVP